MTGSNGGQTWCDGAAWTREDTMTHDESADRSAVGPWRELSVPLPERRPTRFRAAARTLTRARTARVARILTAGSMLGASAIAVVVVATGKAIQILAGEARSTREASRKAVDRGPWPPAADADVTVTWTSVDIRWSSGR
jgi:hypothetical protein